MKIKMLDLSREYKEHKEEYLNAINNVMEKGAFILGDFVNNFEEEFAQYMGSKYAIGVANGTDALLISLIAAGVGKGDEIITTPFTFFATGETIIQAGAKPVFVDIDNDFNINIDLIEKKITNKTKGIIPVHLYGNPVNMDKLTELARKHDLFIIEDCAQSVGATFKNQKTGTFGLAGTISFFPTKNLGCAGDGGAIITNNEEMYNMVKKIRVHGSSKKYYHDILGFNSRLDALQASLLSVKLKYIDEKNKKRREIAEFYNENLNEKIIKPIENDDSYHIYHQYTIIVENRDQLREYLTEKGIASAIHYPMPLHKQEAIIPYIDKTECPMAEEYSKQVLSLPIYPEIKKEELEYIVEKINDFYK